MKSCKRTAQQLGDKAAHTVGHSGPRTSILACVRTSSMGRTMAQIILNTVASADQVGQGGSCRARAGLAVLRAG